MSDEMRIAIVILGAGSGSRFGHSTNKVWLPLDGTRIISRSIANAVKSFSEFRCILVVSAADKEIANEVLATDLPELEVEVIEGGDTRHGSEYNSLMHLAPAIKDGTINVVMIHDGARPLATSALFESIATSAFEVGGALPAIAVDAHEIDRVSNEKIVRVQTPQAFRAEQLLEAYTRANKDSFIGTDTAACMEKYFPELVTLAVAGERENIKITHSQDLIIAEHVLEIHGAD
ncbi:unannotated protein [freshwater metagenome]|uniref:Unannotated protein n=1 Tax=freshwater metagenome TaxID=449393 RepID=A0A6J7DP19_9ZZZZ|nr:IspD/TarI family cytidylyltransferase [Actinomycetota bacterium]MSV64629.1 NTP transferase domain-containing protein [Actinomycetota bacterium]MSW27042.1 NTP transferase domain-containing protein [Actinomycetota bacterium]MSW34741.1 NTP transferase domain-containing protein [Actinomycetota bacterium]MSX31375.1 NTP transferase domain-containing protein [Actinomycetota bacterium]